jgi:hypothetical protein
MGSMGSFCLDIDLLIFLSLVDFDSLALAYAWFLC